MNNFICTYVDGQIQIRNIQAHSGNVSWHKNTLSAAQLHELNNFMNGQSVHHKQEFPTFQKTEVPYLVLNSSIILSFSVDELSPFSFTTGTVALNKPSSFDNQAAKQTHKCFKEVE